MGFECAGACECVMISWFRLTKERFDQWFLEDLSFIVSYRKEESSFHLKILLKQSGRLKRRVATLALT
jgi:hypothetical protein